MDLEAFIADRRPRWQQLERLLDLAEVTAEWQLGVERIQQLVQLYRQACSDLNQARSYTANPELLSYLNQLTGRGYRFVYRGTRRRGWREAVKEFFIHELPAAFRRERTSVIHAALAMSLGALLGLAAVIADPYNGQDLIPGEFFSASPRERVAEIEANDERIDSVEKAADFGAYLYTHNIQVSFLAFSLGALTLIGGYWLLFYNGIILGGVAAMYLLDGVHIFFLAWVGPHGALELPAIVFAGAAGLRAGRALYLPGELSRAAALRQAMPSLWRMLLGSAAILVVAGLIEGSFSQFSGKTVPYSLKISVAVVLFSALITYLFLWRHRE